MENVKVGRISYLNVLPIYHPLETGLIENNFEFVYGPPAKLNKMMSEGLMHISSNSCIEYLRHSEQYLLLPDLAIGSRGPVQSVIMISRKPLEQLKGCNVLVSAQTHTSAALLKILLSEYIPLNASYTTGNATEILEAGELPEAILCIGDEALNLRKHEEYPYIFDLGEEWIRWTGLPFIFGIWTVRRDSAHREDVKQAIRDLIRAKKWGQANIEQICQMTADKTMLNLEESRSYYDGLVYDLGKTEIEGLKVFAKYLLKTEQISHIPDLEFIEI
ncbi:menaquinone biosynthesis protein [Maridesulfovibrio sp.]|uniref:menaquinone biosynthesis protein n=1 Tax=Maridesulfovibrio sp. TaxID=2795000 RepID=UPI0029CA0115|nr:menaquinone biosynthesis protein [Maridesulfovibrio sp.]